MVPPLPEETRWTWTWTRTTPHNNPKENEKPRRRRHGPSTKTTPTPRRLDALDRLLPGVKLLARDQAEAEWFVRRIWDSAMSVRFVTLPLPARLVMMDTNTY